MLRTIKSTTEIDALFQRGTRASESEVVVLAGATPTGRGPEGRVAFVAGKKLGSAVRRNRAKRVLRASARRMGCPWAGYDVVLIARTHTADAVWKDVDASMGRALARAGVTDA